MVPLQVVRFCSGFYSRLSAAPVMHRSRPELRASSTPVNPGGAPWERTLWPVSGHVSGRAKDTVGPGEQHTPSYHLSKDAAY